MLGEAWTSRDSMERDLTNLSGGGAGVLALLAFDGGPGRAICFSRTRLRGASMGKKVRGRDGWIGILVLVRYEEVLYMVYNWRYYLSCR